MSKHALGADINEFYNNILPDDCTVEGMHDYIHDHWNSDDKLSLYTEELYYLDDFGEVHYSDGDWDYFSVEFLKWYESTKVTKLLVTVPKEWAEDVKRGIEYTFKNFIKVECQVEEVQSMKDQKYSDAFLEWRQKFQKGISNSCQNNPFSPEANSYFYAIEDHSQVEEV